MSKTSPKDRLSLLPLMLLSVALGGGCYSTSKIKNGGLLCGTGDSCPDGFVCLHDTQVGQLGHCWRKGTGPADAGPGPDATASDAAGGACTLANATAPYGPFANCTSQQYPKSSCDPVCQSGCPCQRRCVLDNSSYDSFLCEGSTPSSSFIPDLGSCNDPNSTRCSPGSLCVADNVCPYLCYKTCRADSDCASTSRCTANTIVDKAGSSMDNLGLCSPPIEECNPMGTAACATPRSGFACVFLAGMTGSKASGDSTVCDCATLHDKKVGSHCQTLPDDCVPGAVCVDGTCRAICSKISVGSPCSGTGGVCNAIYGSSQYGYCR
jgi:hypothetical protein